MLLSLIVFAWKKLIITFKKLTSLPEEEEETFALKHECIMIKPLTKTVMVMIIIGRIYFFFTLSL